MGSQFMGPSVANAMMRNPNIYRMAQAVSATRANSQQAGEGAAQAVELAKTLGQVNAKPLAYGPARGPGAAPYG